MVPLEGLQAGQRGAGLPWATHRGEGGGENGGGKVGGRGKEGRWDSGKREKEGEERRKEWSAG